MIVNRATKNRHEDAHGGPVPRPEVPPAIAALFLGALRCAAIPPAAFAVVLLVVTRWFFRFGLKHYSGASA